MSSTTPSHEPDVQGMPRSLVSSLAGMAALLAAAGAFFVLVAERESLETWVKAALYALPTLIFLGLHILRVSRNDAPGITPAFFALLGGHAVALPLSILAGIHIAPAAGAPLALVYALTLLWYGAQYHLTSVISAACTLLFALAVATPLGLGLGYGVSGCLLFVAAILAAAAAYYLRRLRTQKLLRLRLAKQRQANHASLNLRERAESADERISDVE